MDGKNPDDNSRPKSLPLNGFSRWHQLKPFLPLGRESWRKLSLEGRAPKRIQLGTRCTVWKNEEIHRWLADPLGYRVE
ncbi:AlpA family phage regulatory protein [Paraburkholderia dipogonis]|uniref:AlpA family phage regulatory protein n=1 Tax=Paraburkholderia dipogonis TaxID=1211383 RepID=A0A4Y8N1X9_9BURK|nr:AlpA family phage regulatory protein [Paraburkholderia dipogonis]TFE43583.1 AlpA family phage regulatory protein [Paraburkholderia dipogonis]